MEIADDFKIFLVDDDRMFLRLLEDHIRHFFTNVKIRSFLTGEECLKNIDQHPDAIILDYFLPGINGFSTYLQIKQKLPEVPVVMLSNNGNVKTIQQMLSQGIYDYIMKGKDYIEELQFNLREITKHTVGKEEVVGFDKDILYILTIGIIMFLILFLVWVFV